MARQSLLYIYGQLPAKVICVSNPLWRAEERAGQDDGRNSVCTLFKNVGRRQCAAPGMTSQVKSLEPEFLAQCIRCTRCADVCDVGCILLFGPGAGKHQGTPYLVPRDQGCTLCLKCGPACPTGALEVLVAKKDARMGTAVVDKRLCVSHNGTGVCGACFTACPLRGSAITQDRISATTPGAEPGRSQSSTIRRIPDAEM